MIFTYSFAEEMMLQLLNPGISSHGVMISMKPPNECFMHGTSILHNFKIFFNIYIGHGL